MSVDRLDSRGVAVESPRAIGIGVGRCRTLGWPVERI